MLTRQDNRLLGVDIGSGFIKVAELDCSCNPPQLTAAAAVELPAETLQAGVITEPAVLADQLRRLLVAAGCRSRQAVFAVGGQAAVVKELRLPVMKENELNEALRWEIGSHIPFAPDSYYYDYAVAGRSGQLLRIITVAARKAAVDALVALAQAAELKPVAVDIEMLAAGRALAGPEQGTVLVTDIGKHGSQLALFNKGIPLAVQTFGWGGQDFTRAIVKSLGLTDTEAESLKRHQSGLLPPAILDAAGDLPQGLTAVARELADAIARTAAEWSSRESVVIDQLVLSGGGARLGNLDSYLVTRTGLSVVGPNPEICPSVSLDARYIGDCGCQLPIAIGLALRGGK